MDEQAAKKATAALLAALKGSEGRVVEKILIRPVSQEIWACQVFIPGERYPEAYSLTIK